ncbi:MAG: nitrous oxide-stimulated promoter family protein [Ignavibacteria bacterium]|nr:nitrous oxide-stimulated promoter family protein [Ignavibacteria bacterium]
MREKVKNVMRYSGPRMLLKHPYLAVRHLLNEKLYRPKVLRSKAG